MAAALPGHRRDAAARPLRRLPMRARIGDRLVVGEDRIGEVVGVPARETMTIGGSGDVA